MEVSSSAVTGAMKIGVQVLSSHKRPFLEIYHQVRNTIGPETKIEHRNINHTHRPQNIFTEFRLINIGGSRAENIKLSIIGNLKRNSPRESFGDLVDVIIPQMAPGQSKFLFTFDSFDLLEYPDEGGQPIGVKEDSFTIKIEYDAGKGFLNWLLSLYPKIRGRRRFCDEYTFYPQLVTGDLPPPEYV